MKKSSLTLQELKLIKLDDSCYDIGGGVQPIGIKVKDPMCGIPRAIQMVSFQHMWCCPSKCKIQVSTIYPNATLCIKRSTPFIEVDDKGGNISTNILREVGFGHEYGQRESNIEDLRRIKNSWTREAHK